MALAFDHSFAIESFHENTLDKASVNGRYYCEKAPAYLALPVPMVASLWLSKAEVLGRPPLANGLLYLGTLLSVALISAISAIFFRRLLVLLNPRITPPVYTLFTLAVYGGTLVLPYSTMLFSHQLAGSLLVIGLYFGLVAVRELEFGAWRRPGYAGVFLMSLAVLCEYPVAIIALALGAGILWQAPERRKLLGCAWVALIPALGLLGHNWASFGNPWTFGYSKLGGSIFEEQMAQGMVGNLGPSLRVVGELLFGLYRGFFIYSPILICALAGFFYWPREWFLKIGLPILSGASALLLFHSGYVYWQGGVAFGPRHLVCLIPTFALGLAYFPARRGPWMVFGVLASLSLTINVTGTATTPFVSEYDTRPLVQSYWELAREGAISINPLGFLNPVADSDRYWESAAEYAGNSFNLGEWLGLSGWLSLLPLGFVWILFLSGLWRSKDGFFRATMLT
jgi:hypothetical protein